LYSHTYLLTYYPTGTQVPDKLHHCTRLHHCWLLQYVTMKPTHSLPRTPNLKYRINQSINHKCCSALSAAVRPIVHYSV